MSRLVEIVDGNFYSVDEIYSKMDGGNRQHMANKLYKHGWLPQKLVPIVPIGIVEACANARAQEQWINITEGDKVECSRSGVIYVASYLGVPYADLGMPCGKQLRLVNTETGALWSRTSLLGATGTKELRRI
jgi:hypothetical protein